MAHHKIENLKLLIRCLDSEYNDFYIHVDKKTDDSILTSLHAYYKYKNNVCIFSEFNVYWGGDSQINCEFFLLEEAKKRKKYLYFHMMSGEDIMVKPRDNIYDFFSNNYPKSYIQYSELGDNDNDIRKIKFYTINPSLVNYIGRKPFWKLCQISFEIQKLVGINRIKKYKSMKIYKGANWFSLSDKAVEYILDQYDKGRYQDLFHHNLCSDEIVIQTILLNNVEISKFIVNENLREIDWNRGQPYIYTTRDQDYLLCLPRYKLFARKADVKLSELLEKKLIINLEDSNEISNTNCQ